MMQGEEKLLQLPPKKKEENLCKRETRKIRMSRTTTEMKLERFKESMERILGLTINDKLELTRVFLLR